MPISQSIINELIAISQVERVQMCEYLKVTWAAGVVRYYAAAKWDELPPFNTIARTIEPRLITRKGDPFHDLELCPDIRTENIKITFDNIDKDITEKFQQYGSGIKCEVILYFPQANSGAGYHHSIWFGQLQAPQMYGWKTLQTVATNGYRSRESQTPSRNHRRECTAHIFGGKFPDLDAIASNLCPYARHLGGEGLLNPATGLPFTDCPKLSKADCAARFGHARYFGGFLTDAAPIISDPNPGHFWIAYTKSNSNNLKAPVPVVFGTKHVRNMTMYFGRRMHNGNTPERGFMQGVWEVCEGPVDQIYNFRMQDKPPPPNYYVIRKGERGQAAVTYGPDVHNFSHTAHVEGTHGWVNANATELTDLHAEVVVRGFKDVCVYTGPTTKTRQFSDNRGWCLLEIYKNQKFGLGYAESEFIIADWIDAATWLDQTVNHTVTWADGETQSYISRRSSFNVILEGRPVGEQVEDICRAGGISVPFQYEGKISVAPFRVATQAELDAAPVFTDVGESVNIIWEGQPKIELSQVPHNKVVNEVEARFEDAANNDAERPIVISDDNQKLKAGRLLGPDYFLAVPKKYSAFGINNFSETMRFARRMLWFGEFDEGGTENNLRLSITVPFERALALKRYQLIKVVSELLDGFIIGTGTNEETPEYFRILRLRKVGKNQCEITAQAYNHTAYSNFETVQGGLGILPVIYVTGAGVQDVNGAYLYVGQYNGKPRYQNAAFGNIYIEWSSSQWRIVQDGTVYYYSNNNTPYPYTALFTSSSPQYDPVALVLIGDMPPVEPPPPGPPPPTVPPIYDVDTGTISVQYEL
jgi:hypothetical protein